MLIEITEASQAGEARRRAQACAEDLRLEESRRGEIALATTEIASNLIKHAGGGHILLQTVNQNGHSGMRVMGVDKGPGIADIGRALAEGQSTAGSMGAGLGIIRRLSSSFDLYSVPGAGTVVSAEFLPDHRNLHSNPVPIAVGVVSEPIAGEADNGDGWGVKSDTNSVMMMVVDGLGHGPLAAEAAREAERILATNRANTPHQVVQDMHDALRKTRGAAGAVARIDFAKRLLTFAGVGNVAAAVTAPGFRRGLVSHNGILGQHTVRVQEFTVPWNDDSVLIMHSDGLRARWNLDEYPGIWSKGPGVMAAVLHRDFGRGRDDATVLIAKASSEFLC
jgi:anti-sigma regulatory factor (Ser/Thr protein kinase)